MHNFRSRLFRQLLKFIAVWFNSDDCFRKISIPDGKIFVQRNIFPASGRGRTRNRYFKDSQVCRSVFFQFCSKKYKNRFLRIHIVIRARFGLFLCYITFFSFEEKKIAHQRYVHVTCVHFEEEICVRVFLFFLFFFNVEREVFAGKLIFAYILRLAKKTKGNIFSILIESFWAIIFYQEMKRNILLKEFSEIS